MRLRKKTPRVILAGIFLCLPLLCVAAAELQQIPVGQAGDAFIAPAIAEPVNLIPFLASDSASAEVSHFIFNGLLKYDANLNLVGDLAESWEVQDNGLRIVFHLRKGVRWQDGYTLTARDVVFTYLSIVDPDVPTPYSSAFEKVETVFAPDEHTVEVRYKESFSPGLSSWTMGIIPMHSLINQDLRTTDFAQHPVGTGPYALRRWVRGELLELRSNPGYYEGKPNIDRVVLRVLPDPATVFLELQNENLDTATLTPLQFNRQIQTDFFINKYQTYDWAGLQYTYLGYNLDHPIFADKRVRQALAMAINGDEMVSAVLMGRGRMTTGPFLPDSWAYDANVKTFSHELSAAKSLLREAGWEDRDKDGVLEREGRKLSFTVLTNGGNDQRRMTCEILQRQLAALGVDMRIQVVEWSVLLKEFIHPRRFEAVLLGWNLALDPDIFDIFHSSRRGPGQFNFVSYVNPEVDRLLEEARAEFDQKKRGGLYHRIHRLIYEDQPYAFLYASDSLSVLHRRFEGVTLGKLGVGHDFVRWYVPKENRRYPSLSADA